jgi:hypothetical protein
MSIEAPPVGDRSHMGLACETDRWGMEGRRALPEEGIKSKGIC